MTVIHPNMTDTSAKIRARDVCVYYGEKKAIDEVSIDISPNYVTAFIGPSGCGKSTFLRCFNRMNDTIGAAKVTGLIELDGEDIHGSRMDVVQLRARVGMVFQKPNPFPKSIYENIAYGPKIHGLAEKKADLDVVVERSLTRAGLWDEVKDRLEDSGTALSGGQDQGLTITPYVNRSGQVEGGHGPRTVRIAEVRRGDGEAPQPTWGAAEAVWGDTSFSRRQIMSARLEYNLGLRGHTISIRVAGSWLWRLHALDLFTTRFGVHGSR